MPSRPNITLVSLGRTLHKWLWRLIFRKVPLKLTEHDGVLTVHAPDGSLRILSKERQKLYIRGIEYRLRKLAQRYGIPDCLMLRPGDLVVDVGANIGEFTIFAARAGCKVIAIEIDPYTLACLRHNTSGLDGILIIEKGLWEKPALLQFYVSPHDANGSFINPSNRSIEVWAEPLDDVLDLSRMHRIRLIKADMEGAEPELLRGATRTLEITEYISIDCGYERLGDRTLEDCDAILRACNFEIIFQSGKHLVAKNNAFGTHK